ncbi:hypothetical protein Tco_0648349 [Tanacetum coccineum]
MSLMATPHRFSAFMINILKIDHLTQELLTGPTYDLIKDTICRQDDVLYKFQEGDFKRLRRQDIEDMLLLLVQGKAHQSQSG